MPFAREGFDPLPGREVLLAAAPQRAAPGLQPGGRRHGSGTWPERARVGGHGVVVEPALDHLAEPFPLSSQRLMQAFSRTFLESFSFACTRSPRLSSFSWKPPLRHLPQMKVKSRKLKVSG